MTWLADGGRLGTMAELKITLEALYRSEKETIELSRRAAALPPAIDQKGERASVARAEIEAEQQRLELAEQGRRSKEGELSDTEAQREKFQGQTALVKTNEEYTALLNEIEQAGDRISKIEEEILVAMDEIDSLGSSLEDLKRQKTREAEAFEGEAKALGVELEGVQSDLAAHDSERQRLARELPTQHAAAYERQFKQSGSGIARVEGSTCSACHRQIPPETINQLIGGELQPCLSCQRILVREAEPA